MALLVMGTSDTPPLSFFFCPVQRAVEEALQRCAPSVVAVSLHGITLRVPTSAASATTAAPQSPTPALAPGDPSAPRVPGGLAGGVPGAGGPRGGDGAALPTPPPPPPPSSEELVLRLGFLGAYSSNQLVALARQGPGGGVRGLRGAAGGGTGSGGVGGGDGELLLRPGPRQSCWTPTLDHRVGALHWAAALRASAAAAPTTGLHAAAAAAAATAGSGAGASSEGQGRESGRSAGAVAAAAAAASGAGRGGLTDGPLYLTLSGIALDAEHRAAPSAPPGSAGSGGGGGGVGPGGLGTGRPPTRRVAFLAQPLRVECSVVASAVPGHPKLPAVALAARVAPLHLLVSTGRLTSVLRATRRISSALVRPAGAAGAAGVAGLPAPPRALPPNGSAPPGLGGGSGPSVGGGMPPAAPARRLGELAGLVLLKATLEVTSTMGSCLPRWM